MPSRKPLGSTGPRPKPSAKRTTTKGQAAAQPRRSATPSGVFVGVGLATVDLLCVGQRLDERKAELGVFSMQGGGSAANMLAGLAMFGARTRYFGRLSDDHFGRFIRAGLDDLGVDTSAIADEPRRVSPVSIIMVDEVTRKRRILFTRGDTSPLAQRDLPPRLLQGAGMLCIDGYQPALQAAIAEKAREKGITVLLNAGHLDGGMGELLALADIVIGSERFASEFAPSDKVEDSLQEITRLGPRVAVITLGAEGAVATDGKKLVEQKPIDVFVADTTGAGDLFSGAFAYAHACGWPLERALPFANAAAGLQCKSLGARGGLPTLEQVMKAWREGAG